ncbi:MAG: hypothetical protein LBF42_01720 [Puniceicoccales bacterium]|jgi:hypothetical protein|nr:hypothetical protein [Puniceicoccales bacterium]
MMRRLGTETGGEVYKDKESELNQVARQAENRAIRRGTKEGLQKRGMSGHSLKALKNDMKARKSVVGNEQSAAAKGHTAIKGQSAALRRSIGQIILDFFDKFIGTKATKFAYKLRDALAIDDKNERSALMDKLLKEFGSWANNNKENSEVAINLVLYLNAVFSNFKVEQGEDCHIALVKGFESLGIINSRENERLIGKKILDFFGELTDASKKSIGMQFAHKLMEALTIDDKNERNTKVKEILKEFGAWLDYNTGIAMNFTAYLNKAFGGFFEEDEKQSYFWVLIRGFENLNIIATSHS